MTTTPERAEFEARDAFEMLHTGMHNATRFADGERTYVDPKVEREWRFWLMAWNAARQSAPESCRQVDDCTESLCMQANRCKHTLPPQPQRLCGEQSAPEEPIAWRNKTAPNGLKRFMTQRQYDAQTPGVKQWYEPFKCASCAATKA